MGALVFLVTVISLASALPVPSPQYDDLFSDSGFSDSGYDISSTTSLGDPFLVASEPGVPGTPAKGGTAKTIPEGYDSSVWNDYPWYTGSDNDASWTSPDRPSRQGDGSMQSPEDKFIEGETGADYEGNYGIIPDANGPTNFALSPDQVTAIMGAGTLVVGGVTRVFNAVTHTISTLSNLSP